MDTRILTERGSIRRTRALAFLALLAACASIGCQSRIRADQEGAAAGQDLVARGKYLVTVGVCNDCHTPWTVGPQGSAPDTTRLLQGHPQELVMDPAPVPLGWGMVAAPTMTAFLGPWGTSFTANLTPDPSGLGNITEAQFKQAMRTGKHFGGGRDVLPPMPWPNYAHWTDEDFSAVWAYLQSIPPIQNVVPDPLPPFRGAPADTAASAADTAASRPGTSS